jgi:hypothetical protein
VLQRSGRRGKSASRVLPQKFACEFLEAITCVPQPSEFDPTNFGIRNTRGQSAAKVKPATAWKAAKPKRAARRATRATATAAQRMRKKTGRIARRVKRKASALADMLPEMPRLVLAPGAVVGEVSAGIAAFGPGWRADLP